MCRIFDSYSNTVSTWRYVFEEIEIAMVDTHDHHPWNKFQDSRSAIANVTHSYIHQQHLYIVLILEQAFSSKNPNIIRVLHELQLS